MKQASALVEALNLQEKEALRNQLTNLIDREKNVTRLTNEKKLAAFAKAVRKKGFLKQLKLVRQVKSVRLPVQIGWEHGGLTQELERSDQIGIGITIDGVSSEDVLMKLFTKEVRALQEKVYTIFKTVEKMAKAHGVDELDWERAVLFLWEES